MVASYGTMIDSLLLFSDNIKRVYRPSYYLRIINQEHINYITIDLDNYKKMLSPWKNTREQQEIMLVYNKVIN